MDTNLTSMLWYAGRYDEAVQQLEKALELNPAHARAYEDLGRCYEQMRRVGEAIKAFRKAASLSGKAHGSLASLAHAYAIAGRPAEAIKIVRQLQKIAKTEFVSSYDFALVFTGLGHTTTHSSGWIARMRSGRRRCRSSEAIHASRRFTAIGAFASCCSASDSPSAHELRYRSAHQTSKEAYVKHRRLLMLFLAIFAVPLFAQDSSGPPQFVSTPILVRVSEQALDHGHFVFSDGAAVPSPISSSNGSATFAGAQKTTSPISSGTDRDASNAPASYEGETAAAGTTLLVGGSNLIYPGNCSTAAAPGTFGDCTVNAYSSAAGSTWTRAPLPRTWNGTNFGICFDPGLDFDKNGTIYYSYGCAPLLSSYPNAVVVAKSSNGVNWTQTTPVTFNQGRNFDDKYYLAVDRSNGPFANRLYVSWDRNAGFNQTLLISYTSDGGATWTGPIKVNDGTSPYERVIGAYPAVDQNTGVVYDSWHDYARNIIFVDKSSDGGNTWGSDVAAAVTHAGFGQDIGCVGGRSQGPAHALKVGPSGNLYLVYADPVANRGFDILLTRSTDGGATWSTPVSLNDDSASADQFHPTISVEAGRRGDEVTISFYDRRDDPSNCFAHVYATKSVDSGRSWSANVRQTSAASNFDGNPNGPGDYSSSTPFTGIVWPFFSDHRSTNPETSRAGAFEIYTVDIP